MTESAAWPPGEGEMASRIRELDWSATPLGPIEAWPQSLKTVVDLILQNELANILVCGPRRVLIYNEACISLYGDEHPRALGLEGPDAFPELWDEIGPLYDRVFAGERLSFQAQPWAFDRGEAGRVGLYDAWFTPGRGENGKVAFAYVTAIEVTEQARAQKALGESEKRQKFLLGLSDALRTLADPDAVAETACRVLVEYMDASRAQYTRVAGEPGAEIGEVRGEYVRSGQPVTARYPLAAFGEPLVAALRGGETLVLGNTDADPRLTETERQAFAALESPAAVVVPLVKDGRFVAKLTVHDAAPREWIAAEVELVEAVAERTWAAVERARAEAALRASEDQFSSLFAASPAPFLILGPDAPRFTIVEVNEAYLAATMRTREQLVGRGVFEAFPDNPDDEAIAGVSTLRASFERVLATHRPDTLLGLKYDVARPDGTFEERWWSPINSAVLGANGEVEAIIHNAHDVTEQYRAEAALRESEARFREQFENANDFIFTADLEMRLTSANPAVARALGHGVEDLIGRSISEFVPAEMWERNKAMLGAKLAGDAKTTRYEVEVFDPRGGRMTWEINSRLTRDASGAPTGLHAIGRDVTERKRAEEALRESEQRFRRIADSTPAPMWVTRLDRKRDFVNRAYVEFLGISYEEAVDFDWREILHPEDHDRIVAESIAGEASLEPFVLEARYRRKDGEWHWMRSTSQPRFNADGEHIGFIGVAHDVTVAKEADVALRESGNTVRRARDYAEATLRTSPVPLLVLESDLRVVTANDAFYERFEVDPAQTEGRLVYQLGNGQWDIPQLREWLESVLPRLFSFDRYEITHDFQHIGRRTMLLNGRRMEVEEGGPERIVLVMEDITRRKQAEDALRTSEERLRLILDSVDEYAIFTLDRKGMVTSWNEGAERLLGYSEAEAVGMDGCEIFTPDDRANGEADREIETALAEGRATNERWHLRKDGSRFWGSGAVLSMLDGNGNGNGNGTGEPVLVKIMRDETQRVLDQDRQKLLLAELQHRVRNVLGMIRSLVRQSLDGHELADDFAAHLSGRLDAMARTQVLLSHRPDARVDLEGLVRDELRAQAGDERRIAIEGPEVRLPAKAAEVLALAVHELATNSLKYGALAGKGGHLRVGWSRCERDGQEWVALEWDETSPVTHPEAVSAGFGRALIERRVPYELRGEASMTFSPTGLCARISFPIVERASILETGPARGPL